MKLFGHLSRSDDEQPSSLSEVTLLASAVELRSLAAFLLKCADDIEQRSQDFDHQHWRDADETVVDQPDIIVVRQDGR
jgi:hypothetical protein